MAAFPVQITFFAFLVFFPSAIKSNIDYYQIAFQWPGTVCVKTTCKPKVPTQKSFTLHGLWPDDTKAQQTPQYKKKGPKQCTPTLPYKVSTDTTRRASLETVWPNIEDTSNNIGFWTHEWNTHGNCYVDTSPNKQDHYFDLAIKLFGDADINTVLFPRLQIGASNTLNVSQHIETSSLKVIPIVKFFYDRSGVAYLWEVVICHDGTVPIHCPPNRRSSPAFPILPNFSYQLP